MLVETLAHVRDAAGSTLGRRRCRRVSAAAPMSSFVFKQAMGFSSLILTIAWRAAQPPRHYRFRR